MKIECDDPLTEIDTLTRLLLKLNSLALRTKVNDARALLLVVPGLDGSLPELLNLLPAT